MRESSRSIAGVPGRRAINHALEIGAPSFLGKRTDRADPQLTLSQSTSAAF